MANTRSSMIEDAAMEDERGDDMPDNESNEWEVGQVLICSSQSRDVFAVSHRSFDIYLCTLHAGRWCEPSAAWFVSSYWPSYFIARSRVQKKVCYFQFEYFCAVFKLHDVQSNVFVAVAIYYDNVTTKCNKLVV